MRVASDPQTTSHRVRSQHDRAQSPGRTGLAFSKGGEFSIVVVRDSARRTRWRDTAERQGVLPRLC